MCVCEWIWTCERAKQLIRFAVQQISINRGRVRDCDLNSCGVSIKSRELRLNCNENWQCRDNSHTFTLKFGNTPFSLLMWLQHIFSSLRLHFTWLCLSLHIHTDRMLCFLILDWYKQEQNIFECMRMFMNIQTHISYEFLRVIIATVVSIISHSTDATMCVLYVWIGLERGAEPTTTMLLFLCGCSFSHHYLLVLFTFC